jgi:thiol-disulfide isomerase/thioredoxin
MKILISTLVLLFAINTTADAQKKGKKKGNKDGFSISGVIQNATNETLYFEKFDKNKPVKLDSAIVNKKGKFEMTPAKIANTGFYRLSFSKAKYVMLILTPEDAPVLTADAENMYSSYTVTGSKHSELTRQFFRMVDQFIDDQDTLNKQLTANQRDPEKNREISKKLADVQTKFTEDRNNFIKANPESPALAAVLSHLNPQTDIEQYKSVHAAIEKTMPESPYVDALQAQITKIEAEMEKQRKQRELAEKHEQMFGIGKELPDINMKTVDEQDLALSSLKGKVVLVDFWASWCRPCRAENPNVVKLYNKYKEKGFDVYSVSLDNNKEKWINAIATDKLAWPSHVSELKSWQSQIVKEFGIRGIPHTILIDKDGKIVGNKLRGPALESKLKEMFGF